MEFVLVGDLGRSRSEIEKMIKKLGGKLVPQIHSNLAAVISTKQEVEKMGTEMMAAKENNIQVVSEDFLNEIPTTDAVEYIIQKCICDWGDDVSFV